MAILYYLLFAETLRTNKNIKVLASTPGLHDMEINYSLTKDDYVSKGVYEVEVGMAPVFPQKLNNHMQDQQKQYVLNHLVVAKIHA